MIVDDQQIIREGLSGMLGRESDLLLVGTAENGKEAVELAAKCQPDVVLMDLRMPLMGGADAIRAIHKAQPKVGFIILTVYDRDDEILEGLRAGAKAFLLKDVSREELVQAMHTVAQGKAHIHPEFASLLIDRLSDDKRERSILPPISQREKSVLQLLAKGSSNKEIGVALSISQHTVKSHVANFFEKLDVHDRAAAVAKAIQKRIIQV